MLNKVIIMGRLVATPELLKTGTGRSYTHLRLACDRDGTGGKDREKITDWLDATAWGRTAEFIVKYFSQGDPILIEGAMHSRSWSDREGKKRYSVEINVDNVNFCGRRTNAVKPASVLDGGSGFTDLGNDGTDLPFTVGDDDGNLPWDDTSDKLPL